MRGHSKRTLRPPPKSHRGLWIFVGAYAMFVLTAITIIKVS